MEVIKFIFGSFWHWLGATIMLGVICHGLSHIFTIRIKKITIDPFDDEDYK